MAMLEALRSTLRSWRPHSAPTPLWLELVVSAVPSLDYEQWVGLQPTAERMPTRSEFKAFLREFGQVVREECARTSSTTISESVRSSFW